MPEPYSQGPVEGGQGALGRRVFLCCLNWLPLLHLCRSVDREACERVKTQTFPGVRTHLSIHLFTCLGTDICELLLPARLDGEPWSQAQEAPQILFVNLHQWADGGLLSSLEGSSHSCFHLGFCHQLKLFHGTLYLSYIFIYILSNPTPLFQFVPLPEEDVFFRTTLTIADKYKAIGDDPSVSGDRKTI